MRIYFISGIGVDGRMFMNLDLPGHELHYIQWIIPGKEESLPSYALRLAAQISIDEPFALVGLSFGGMCAMEIAKVYKPEKLILLSSAKGEKELPWDIKIYRYLPLNKLFRKDGFYIRMALLIWKLFGFRGKEQYRLFKDMLATAPRGYFARASDCIINWRNREYYPCLHIHGDRDKILFFHNIRNPYRIRGGEHVCVLNNAEEVSLAMKEYLDS